MYTLAVIMWQITFESKCNGFDIQNPNLTDSGFSWLPYSATLLACTIAHISIKAAKQEVPTFGISNQNLWNVAPDCIACSSVDNLADMPRDTGVRPSQSALRRRMSLTHILACSMYSPELPYSDSTQCIIIRRVKSQWHLTAVREIPGLNHTSRSCVYNSDVKLPTNCLR